MDELHIFLCSAIVVDDLDRIYFEESFLIGKCASSETEAYHAVAKRLETIETECNKELMMRLILSVHCPFFMPDYTDHDLVTKETVFMMFEYLSSIRIHLEAFLE